MRNDTLLSLAFTTLLGNAALAQSFTAQPDLPGDTRDGAISFAIGNKVYLGGGISGSDFYQYDPATDQWTAKASIPNVSTYRAFGTAFAIGGKGYVCLGNDNNVFKHDLWEYDPALDTWTQKADYPAGGRNTASAFAVNGKGYVCGGADANYIYSDLFEYDPVTDAWTHKAALPIGATAFATTFSVGNFGYITGGDQGTSETAHLYRYDPVNDTWTQKADFIGEPRQTAVAFVLNGLAYVGLGQSHYTTAYDDFFSYDAATDTWASAGTFPGGVRCWATACATSDRAYVGTGWDFASTFFHDLWEFAPTVGMAESVTAAMDLDLFPVPAQDVLSVRVRTPGSATVRVFDVSGRTVATARVLMGRTEVDLGALPAGTYTLLLTRPDGASAQRRFVKL